MTNIDSEITLETPMYKCILKKSCSVMRTICNVLVYLTKLAMLILIPAGVIIYLLDISNILLYVVELGRGFRVFLSTIPVWIIAFAGIVIISLAAIVIYSFEWCLEKRSNLLKYSEPSSKWGIPIALFRDSTDEKIVSVAIPRDRYKYGMIDIVFSGDGGGRNLLADVKIYGDVVLEPFSHIENAVLVLDYLNEQLHIPSKIVILGVDKYHKLPSANQLIG